MKSNIFTATAFSLSLLCMASANAIESQEDAWVQARALNEAVQKRKLERVDQLSAAVEAKNGEQIKDALKGLTEEQCLELFMTPSKDGKRAIDALVKQYATPSRLTIMKYSGLSLDQRFVCYEIEKQ